MLDRGEYGTFFPADLSQNGFGYSAGELFFGYTDEELKQFGAPLFDPNRGAVTNPVQVSSADILQVSQLPDNWKEADSKQFVGKPIFDPVLGRSFSIVPAEFAFYQSYQLPLPVEHFLTRLKRVARLSNMPVSDTQPCEGCGIEIRVYRNSTFSNRRHFCRACYLQFLEKNS